MRRSCSLAIVVCAILLALTFVFGMIPTAFLLPTLFAVCCFGFAASAFASISFGVVSLILFFTNPFNLFYSTVGWYFVNYPWMPIVARMFIGPLAHAFFLGLSRLTRNFGVKGKVASISLTAAFGSLLNTVFVGLLIFLVGSEGLPQNFDKITLGFLAVNGAIEIAVTAVILPPIVLSVKKAAPKLFIQLEGQKYRK